MRLLLFILLLTFSGELIAQSNTRVFPDQSKAFMRNGRKGYSLQRLFDGDTLTKIDGTGGVADELSSPWESWIILDSFYNNMKLQSWQATGSGGFVVTVLTDDNDNHMIESNGWLDTGDSLGQFTLTVSQFQAWVTLNFHTFNNVRALRFQATTYADKTAGIWEIRLYGDKQAIAPTIYRTETIVPNADPGKHGHGMGMLDNVNVDSARRMANSFRIGYIGTTLDSEVVNKTLPLLDANFVYKYNRFGYNYFNTRIFNTARINDIKVQNYFVGGNIKHLSDPHAATFDYNNWSEATKYKYMEPGGDSSTKTGWAGYARFWRQYAGFFGTNTSFNTSGYFVTGMPVTAGQGGLDVAEIGNEYQKDWRGSTAFHSPTVLYTMMDTVTTAIKEVDPNIYVSLSSFTYLDTTYLKALFFENWLRYGTTKAVEWDGAALNIYLNSERDGQNTNASLTAITPERWKLKDRFIHLGSMLNKLFPNHSTFSVTEFGFSIDSVSSSFEVPAIAGISREHTKANWGMRYKKLAQIGGAGYLRRLFWYWYFKDGSGTFNLMNAADWDGTKDTLMPVGKCFRQQRVAEDNYQFWATHVVDGDSTGVHIAVQNAVSGTNKLFSAWRGTYNNSTSSYTLNLGAGASTAKLITLRYYPSVAIETPLTINGSNEVTFTVTEMLQYVEVTYSEEENQSPTAAAGTDQTITLPTSQVTVNGSSSSDPDGTISTYLWTKVSGPSTFTITNSNSSSTTITGLVAGTYVFRLTVTDDDSGEDTDDITITVNAAPPSNRRSWFHGTLRNKFRRG